jgi:hypothetical protein
MVFQFGELDRHVPAKAREEIKATLAGTAMSNFISVREPITISPRQGDLLS